MATVQRQTAVTAYFSSKQLPLSVFAEENGCRLLSLARCYYKLLLLPEARQLKAQTVMSGGGGPLIYIQSNINFMT